MENRKYHRVPTFVVLGMLVFSMAWVEGCGGILGSGSGASGTLTGTVVDSSTKNPVSGALVVLEQPDGSGIDRIVSSTVSASNGTFGFKPTASGTYDVVADATGTTSSTMVTYAATVTFGVLATASLGQIPLVSVTGSSTNPGSPVTLTNQVTSAGMAGTGVPVDVTLSALQSVLQPVGSITQITIPVFAPSTLGIMTGPNSPTSPCPSGTDCASYSLLVPAGDFSFGTFSASGTLYTLSTQQSQVTYLVEGKASPTCTTSTMTSPIIITNGNPGPANPQLAFTGCL